MLHENEVVMLALGCAVYVFATVQGARLERIPHWRLLFTAFRLLLVAWAATVLEGLVLPGVLNVVEHVCQALAALVFAAWSLRAVRGGPEAGAEC